MWRNVLAPVLVVVSFWLVSSITTTYYVRWLERTHASLLAENLATIRATGEMRFLVRRLQEFVLGAGPKRGAQGDGLGDLAAEFRAQLAETRANAVTAEEQPLVARIETAFDAYLDTAEQLVERAEAGQPPTTADIQRLVSAATRVADPCKRLAELNEELILAGSESARQYGGLITGLRVTALVVGPGMGLLVGFWLSRRLHRSIARVSVTLENAHDAHAAPLARVDVDSSPDLPQLEAQAQAVAERIRNMLGALEDARRDADAAARLASVGELAAGVAHELRNPLTSIKLLIQSNTVQLSGAAPQRETAIILQEISRMEESIERLLQFARPHKASRKMYDLRQSVQRAVNLAHGRAAQRGLRITVQQPDTEVPVCADAEQVHQAITNLIINAIDAMGDRGTLDLNLGLDAKGTHAILEVADSGPGIPPALLEHIFEPFVSGKAGGTGLGLAISRRAALENGGTLEAFNRPGGGAVLRMQLPLANTPGQLPAGKDFTRRTEVVGHA